MICKKFGIEQRHGDIGVCIGGWWVERGLLSFVRGKEASIWLLAFAYITRLLGLEDELFLDRHHCIGSWLALCLCAQGMRCRAGCGGARTEHTVQSLAVYVSWAWFFQVEI